MARGDMNYESVAIASNVEILNRTPFEGVSMTIDFSGVDTGVVKAGTPINNVGVAVTSTPFVGAVGILLHDVYATRPQGTILKKAYIKKAKAEANASVSYDAALITELAKTGCRIVLE